ncbi:hypothetical protein [Shimia sp.]
MAGAKDGLILTFIDCHAVVYVGRAALAFASIRGIKMLSLARHAEVTMG